MKHGNAVRRGSLLAVVAFLLAEGVPFAEAGGGAGKSIQTFLTYQNPGPDLQQSDAAKLARYDIFSFNRRRYYAMTPDTYTAVRAINPEILIFNYQQGPDTWTDQDGSNVLYVNNIVRYNNTYGHSMGNLNTDNPDLFLLDMNGERMNTYYKWNRWVLDFGHPDFQAYWLEATEHDIVDQEWCPDGIFVDNCMPLYPSYFCDVPQKYPTDPLWRAAMHSYHTALAAGLHDRGILLMTNTGDVADPDGYDAWLDLDADPNYPDFIADEGVFCHGWGSASSTFYSYDKWKRQVDIMTELQNASAIMFCHVNMAEGASGWDNYGRPVTYWDALWYAMGSYLLGKNDQLDNAYFFFSNKVDAYYKLYWYDEYEQIDLGEAVGDYQRFVYQSKYIHSREFENGYVYVNPNGSGITGLALPQACKRLSHATILDDPNTLPSVTSIDLDAHRAAILLTTTPRTTGTTRPPTPATTGPSLRTRRPCWAGRPRASRITSATCAGSTGS